MRVVLVRAWPGRHELVEVSLPEGARVNDALRASGWALGGGESLAVFGVAARGDTPLREGDRIELLRPLAMDPKQARRLRAERANDRA